jgi:hypothetical protein
MDFKAWIKSWISASPLAVLMGEVVCLIAIIAFFVVRRVFVASPAYYRSVYPAERLDEAIIQDLCREFGLSGRDPVCGSESEVYSTDFFPIIRATFETGETTYKDVEDKLGQYQYHCDPLELHSDDKELIDCWYAFTEDRIVSIRFSFSSDGILRSLSFESSSS